MIRTARETPDPVITAVATAHMPDYSIGAAEYALKSREMFRRLRRRRTEMAGRKTGAGISELIIIARQKKKLKRAPSHGSGKGEI